MYAKCHPNLNHKHHQPFIYSAVQYICMSQSTVRCHHLLLYFFMHAYLLYSEYIISLYFVSCTHCMSGPQTAQIIATMWFGGKMQDNSQVMYTKCHPVCPQAGSQLSSAKVCQELVYLFVHQRGRQTPPSTTSHRNVQTIFWIPRCSTVQSTTSEY